MQACCQQRGNILCDLSDSRLNQKSSRWSALSREILYLLDTCLKMKEFLLRKGQLQLSVTLKYKDSVKSIIHYNHLKKLTICFKGNILCTFLVYLKCDSKCIVTPRGD